MAVPSTMSSSMTLPDIKKSGDMGRDEHPCVHEADLLLWPPDCSSVDKLWPGVENYLRHAAHMIRTDSAELTDRLKHARHRMTWYTVIYTACSGQSHNSAEMYRRLSLFLLNDLETNVLRPLLSKGDVVEDCLPSTDLCHKFVQQYKQFMVFGRVVLSCFGCLDYHYTEKYSLDSVTALCVKMFYAVVYRPLKERLVQAMIKIANEVRSAHQNGDLMSAACVDVQQVLAVIAEILSKVKTFSLPGNDKSHDHKGDGLGACGHTESRTKEWNTVCHFAAAVTELEHTPSLSNTQAEKNNFLKRESTVKSHSNSHPARGSDTVASTPLNEICALRERLEKRFFADTTAPGSSATRNNSSSGGSGGRGGNTKGSADPAEVFLVNTTQPLHLLLLADFGVRYIRAAEEHYRDQRAIQLATLEKRHDYMSWMQSCLDIEWALVKDVGVAQFLGALRKQMHQVLLVEVHQLIIYDPEFGLRAQLEAWYNGRHKRCAGDITALSVSNSVARPSDFWGQLSEEEIKRRIKVFVAAFANAQDNACLALLASEFVRKMVMDMSAPFLAYMAQVEEATQQPFASLTHTRCRSSITAANKEFPLRAGDAAGVEPNTLRGCAMTLVERLVDVTILYSGLVHEQFDDHSSMLAAMDDVLRLMLNPERWGQLGEQVAEHDGADLSSARLHRDTAQQAAEAVGKLIAARGSGEVPTAQFFAVYCSGLCGPGEVDAAVARGSTFAERAEHIAELVELMDDKNVFFGHYKQLLARRLLLFLPTQIHISQERIMVDKLRQTVGPAWTHSLGAMLQDYEFSVEMRKGFCQTPAYHLLSVKLRVQVITAVHWPKYCVTSMLPCDSLAHAMSAFTEYYTSIHPSRRLHWIHTLGSAVLHAVFPKGTKEIVADTILSNILILVSNAYNVADGRRDDTIAGDVDGGQVAFARGRSLSGREIAAAMGMNFSDIYAHLALLVRHEPYSLLRRVESPKSAIAGSTLATTAPCTFPPLMPEDMFTLNLSYTHKMRKFKLPAACSLVRREERGTIGSFARHDESWTALSPPTAGDTRRVQMDAAIIKIMKRRGSLRYHELLEATTEQLSRCFAPCPRLLKMATEYLIGRGFLRRSDTDASVLEYVA